MAKSILGGLGKTFLAGAITSSAKPPLATKPKTSSPSFRCFTALPTELTTPAISLPGVKGSSGLYWYFPWIIRVSGKFKLQAFTLITTSFSPGVKAGRSLRIKSDGGPYFSHTIAFISFYLRLPAIDKRTGRFCCIQLKTASCCCDSFSGFYWVNNFVKL